MSATVVPQSLDCYVGCTPPVVTHPTGSPVIPHVQVAAPLVHLASHAPLPFTGADVQELAVIGLGAVVAGGLLLIRRRRHVAA